MQDLPAVNEIFNHYVRTSTVTFETQEWTDEERSAWHTEHGDKYPVVVAERDGEIVGWGSASRWSERKGWMHTVEFSVYVKAGVTGGGIGPAILDALIAACRAVGHHVALAQIVADNEPCLKMVENAGFERLGVMKEVGYKYDRWLDLALVELLLDEANDRPPSA